MKDTGGIGAGPVPADAAGASLLRLVPAPLRPLLAKIMRFSVVGALSGLLYAVFTTIGVQATGLDPKLASLAAYAGVVPINFLLQRNFTFRSEGAVAFDLVRYGVAQVCNTLMCFAVMWLAVDLLSLHYAVGIVLGIAVVPFVTFFIMDRWVFSAQRQR